MAPRSGLVLPPTSVPPLHVIISLPIFIFLLGTWHSLPQCLREAYSHRLQRRGGAIRDFMRISRRPTSVPPAEYTPPTDRRAAAAAVVVDSLPRAASCRRHLVLAIGVLR